MTQQHAVQATKAAVGLLLIAFGFGTAAAALPALAEPARLFIDLVIWPLDGRQSLASPEARLLCAILGGVLVGWGVTLWLLLDRGDSPRTATHSIIKTGLFAWFVIDSTGSVLAGVPLNVAANAAILAPLLWGLNGIARHATSEAQS